jgi:hypothetical protein
MRAWDVPLHVRQRIESKWSMQQKRLQRQRDDLRVDESSCSDGVEHADDGGGPVQLARARPAIK